MFKESKIKIRTADIPVEWLNARCRNLISKYAVIAHRVDGTVLDLSSNKILSDLSRHTRSTDTPELKNIYSSIKHELRKIVSSPSLKMTINIMSQKQSYLEKHYSH